MKNKKIIIAGGTGFIGQAMVRYFAKDNWVVVLSRRGAESNNNYNQRLYTAADGYSVTYRTWDGEHMEEDWAKELEGADLLVNLAGKSVNCRYHIRNRQAVVNSRINSTRILGEALRQCKQPPSLWINAASATVYRNATDRPQDEDYGEISTWKKDNMPYTFIDRLRYYKNKCLFALRHTSPTPDWLQPDKDFSVAVCRAWEHSFFGQYTPQTRKIALRTAITLGTGGVLLPYFTLLKLGLGGHQGNGRQMYSWVHVEDFCRTLTWCYEQREAEGIFNCAAPGPVTNRQFMQQLRASTGHRIGLPAYSWMVEAGTALIGSESELILKSRWVVPARLLQAGFRFKYPQLKEAVDNIVAQTPRRKYHLF